MHMNRGSGNELTNQTQQHQDNSAKVRWCNRAANIMDIKWVQDLMRLVRSSDREEFEDVIKREVLPRLCSPQTPAWPSREAPWQEIRSEEVEAMEGAIPTPELHCQCAQAVKDLIPNMVEAMRLQFAQEIRASIPVMLKEMHSQYAQDFKAFIPVMVDEVLKKLDHNPSSRSVAYHAEPSASRILQLHLDCILPDDVLFTMTKLQNHEGASVRVELRDGSGSIVEDGPESSAMIEISLLDGGFKFEERDDWTAQDFDEYVAKPRDDKGPLLKGDRKILLSKGVAVLGNLTFTDNSRATRNGKFRFRVQVVKGLPHDICVKDAVSKPFRVKERRGRKKPRSLQDKIEHLKYIGPASRQELASAKIHTLQDFLQKYHTDAKSLQEILHLSENEWSKLVEDAKSCLLTDKGYQYNDEESGVAGVLNGRACQPHHLDDTQKDVVNGIRRIAYEKRNELPRIDIHTNQILMQAESVSLSSVAHTNTGNPDAAPVDMATGIIMPGVNPTFGKMGGGHDMFHSLSPEQTNQGEQMVLHSSPGHLPETELILSPNHSPEAVLPSKAGPLVDDAGDQEVLPGQFSPGHGAEHERMLSNLFNCDELSKEFFDGIDDFFLENQCGVTFATKVRVFRSIVYAVRFMTVIKLTIKGPRALKRQRQV